MRCGLNLATQLGTCLLAVALLTASQGCGGDNGGGSPYGSGKPSTPTTAGDDNGGKPDGADSNVDWDSLEGWGDLTGRFVYDGTPPKPAALAITKDIDYCGKFGLTDQRLLVAKDGGLANVVIYLRSKVGEFHESYAASADAEVELANKNCRFVPHIVLIRLSQTLLVTSYDPKGHNTNCQPLADEGFNPTVTIDSPYRHQFMRRQNVPWPTNCNIHPWMACYVLIRDNPYMAVTGPDGTFTIKNLPAGKWEFQAWHERSGYLAVGDWTRGRFEQGIKPDESNDLGTIRVPAKMLNK